MKCPVCDVRKGKRFCPAKQREICPQCCGEKRVIEIACPPDCPYLTSGQNYQRVKDYVAQLGTLESVRERERVLTTSIQYSGLIETLEKSVVEYASDLRSLRDSHIGDAFAALRETYQTEARGIIYQQPSPNPLVQALIKQLSENIEGYRAEVGSGDPPVGPSEVVDCLKVLELNVRHYRDGSGQDYLHFIRRSHPDAAPQGGTGGGLITL